MKSEFQIVSWFDSEKPARVILISSDDPTCPYKVGEEQEMYLSRRAKFAILRHTNLRAPIPNTLKLTYRYAYRVDPMTIEMGKWTVEEMQCETNTQDLATNAVSPSP
jgi:hypothetical protein